MRETERRSYTSELRRDQAAATRQRIAESARTLMLEQGYAATRMADVARGAGVAVQTLYATCPGGKAGLAKLVYDVALAGDGEAIPQAARPQVQAIIAEPDAAQKLVLYADLALSIARRITPVYRLLRAAAAATPTDTALHALLDQTEHQHRTGSRGPATHLAEIGALRRGLSVTRAGDQIYALTSIEVYDRLVTVCGWDGGEYRDWLAAALRDALLERGPGAVSSP